MKTVRAFGAFRFDPESGELWRDERIARLPNQPARILDILTSRAGELVTRDDLREAIWKDGTFVDFNGGLNYCIRRIRVALEDDAEAPQYLETVPRRGYRFIAPVSAVPTARSERRASRRERSPLAHRRWVPAACLGLLAGVIVGLVSEQSPWHEPVVQWLHNRIGLLPGVCYWPWG